jgi:hypothetical protein
MSENFEEELLISERIKIKLSADVSETLIDSFHIENQFQFSVIAIYILGKKDNNVFFHDKFKKFLIETTKNFKVEINILYNFIINEEIFDQEYMQGEAEVMRGYSIESFGYSSELSETIEPNFYSEMARKQQKKDRFPV